MDCCEDVEVAGYLGTLKFIFYVPLPICCFSWCRRQDRHMSFPWTGRKANNAWEVSMRKFLKHWVQCFVPAWLLIWERWRLLSWRSPNTTSTRVTRYWTQQTTMSGMMHMGTACSHSCRECCWFRILHVLHLGELWCYYGPLLSHAIADTLYSSLALFASWNPVKRIYNLISFGKEAKQDW